MTYEPIAPGAESSDFQAITPEQFEKAYIACFSRTVSFLTIRGATLELAEDLAQAAWARGWEYRAQLRDPSLVSYWVSTIARNLFYISYRGLRPTEALTENSATVSPDWTPLLIDRMLRDLHRTDRELLLETYTYGSTSDELGPRLGVSAVAVRVRLNRLRKALRLTFGAKPRATTYDTARPKRSQPTKGDPAPRCGAPPDREQRA